MYNTENKKKKIFRSLESSLFALSIAVLIFCVSVIVILNFRALYYFDIRYLKISAWTGLEEEIIKRNYDILIDYNLIWKGPAALQFPDFPMSEGGQIHFMEVRRIFYAIQYIGLADLPLFAVGLFRAVRRKDHRGFRLAAILTVVVPLVLGTLAAINWEAFFITFHRIFFHNDYWLFDPATDPVINILPDTFFLHCAAGILILILGLGLICELTGRILRHSQKR